MFTFCITFCRMEVNKLIFKRKFEWDEIKDKTNIRKHGISFKQATKVFKDNNRIITYDVMHSKNEERYNIIGKINKLYFVVYTVKHKDTIRIISARKANKKEEKIYHENLLRK